MSNTNTTSLNREELVERLKANQDSDGYFTISSEEKSIEQPTDNNPLLVYSAIEKFENSLDRKAEGKTLFQLVF